MTMPLAAALLTALQCAPDVAPETLLSVVHVESRFDPLAIGVNGTPRLSVHAATKAEAVSRASALISAGRSVDLGLGQINSHNLGWLGLTLEDAFEPCSNLAAAARILQAGYRRSGLGQVAPQAALQTALSFYNTGRPDRGFANGYVGKVLDAAAHIVPAVATPSALRLGASPALAAPRSEPAAAPWDVFGDAAGSTLVLHPQDQASGDRP